MTFQFHLIIEKGEKYFIGYCPEVPGANGQGKTKAACRKNLLEAMDLILQTRGEEGRRGVPKSASVEVLSLK